MIKNISPIDGRYSKATQKLQDFFSEYALIKYRVKVEIEFFKALLNLKEIDIKLSSKEIEFLDSIYLGFDESDALKVKEFEATTNHDVKAVEYFIKEKLISSPDFEHDDDRKVLEFIHFACTSEDINNLSYALMLKEGISQIMIPAIENMTSYLDEKASKFAGAPMLSRTHGQPASPTTMGKEIKIYEVRFRKELENLKKIKYLGKINGASGNYCAHSVAFPEIDWLAFSQEFVEKLGLTWNAFTYQIEPHDFIAEIFDSLSRISTILIDMDKDMWTYISLGFFKQKVIEGEVGSSAMPHKVNPIDFENSEGNAGLAIGMFAHMARKLPITRLQRDLTDSTVLRNIGVGLAYLLIAIKSTDKGLLKLDIDYGKLDNDLDDNWEILAEAIQTVMRKNGIDKPYERLKELTRGKKIGKKDISDFVKNLEINADDKQRLLDLTPQSYVGLAEKIAKMKYIS